MSGINYDVYVAHINNRYMIKIEQKKKIIILR